MDQLSITIDKIWPIVDLNWIEIVATMDWTAEIGSKKSIKSRFESDLDRILAGSRSNGICLVSTIQQNQMLSSDSIQYLDPYYEYW